jgi:hypothetical protein
MQNKILVATYQQIMDDPYLPQQVWFFLKTLAEEAAA